MWDIDKATDILSDKFLKLHSDNRLRQKKTPKSNQNIYFKKTIYRHFRIQGRSLKVMKYVLQQNTHFPLIARAVELHVPKRKPLWSPTLSRGFEALDQ